MSRAAKWRAAARAGAIKGAVELALPSGTKILARRPDPVQLAMWARLPFSLTAAAAPEAAGPAEMTGEDVMALAQTMRDVLLWCCVEPRVTLEPRGEDEMHPRDIPDEDLHFLFRWALRGEEAARLEGFRGRRADEGGGGDGADVRTAAVGAAGNRG